MLERAAREHGSMCSGPSSLVIVMVTWNWLETPAREVFLCAQATAKVNLPGTQRSGPCSPTLSRKNLAQAADWILRQTKMKRQRTQESASTSVDLLALRECVEQFNTKTIVLLGDFVADEISIRRNLPRLARSPSSDPKHRETKVVPGGGANAANNLASLGARVCPSPRSEIDAPGDALIAHFRRQRVRFPESFGVKGWSTPTKTRFLAGWAHTVGQQVLRVDYEPKSPLPDAIRKKLYQRLSANLHKAHALAVSDYGLGVCNSGTSAAGSREAQWCFACNARRALSLHRYAKAGITSATPNESRA